MKKIIFFICVTLCVFYIYFLNVDKKIYLVSIGDYLSYGINNLNKINVNYNDELKKYYKNKIGKYVNYSSYDDYRVNDLINDINYNKIIEYNGKEYRMQNLLIKSNYLILSIGMNDLIYKQNLNYIYIDELLTDIEELFKIVRKYNKDSIYFLSFYNVINNKSYIEYSNNKLKSICKKYNINYIDISNLNSYILVGRYPTDSGYLYIKDKIINFTN